jgi:hypothetical protein
MNIFKDKDGLTYAHPERSCKRCLNYPCIENMDTLLSDFAKYGCIFWNDSSIFKIPKS